VTDGSGNTATCNQTVTVVDNINPTITCPSAQTLVLGAACSANLPNYTSLATVSDNCTSVGAIVVTQSPAAGTSVSGVGATIITLTATDASGNSSICTFNVNRVDNTAPTVICPGNLNAPVGSSCTAVLANYTGFATASDNCTATASIIKTQSPIAGTIISVATTVTITATDASGNFSTCSFVITPVDNTTPAISCPGAQTLVLNSSCSSILPNYTSLATATDNCSSAASLVITQSPTAGTTVSGVGVTVITLTATDSNGNTATCTFNVNRVDNTLPTITCPANITVNVAAGTCSATVSAAALGTPTTADNCSVGSVTNNHPSTTYSVGTTTVIWTVTDGSGNTATCNQTVTVVDNIVPTVTCPAAQTLVLGAACTATIPNYTTLATVSDNCTAAGAIVVTQSPAAGTSVSGVGITVITLTATDASGNSSNCTFNVNRVDTSMPSISGCPSDQAVSFSASCNYLLLDYITTFGIASSDNCDNSVTLNQSPSAGTAITANTTVTITATDDNGNMATCTFVVMPSDNTSPNITNCPANFTVSNNASCQYVIPNFVSTLGINANDNCDAASSLIFSQSPAAGTTVSGPTLIQITVMDTQGNMSVCAFTITPIDSAVPTVICPSNINTQTDAGFSSAVINTPNATAADNCSVASLTWTLTGATSGSSPATGINYVGTQTFNTGITTVAYIVTDGAGNTAACSFTVTVSDSQAPSITCPSNITQNATNGACTAFVTVPLATASDNDGIASILNSYNNTNNASDTYPVGTTIVTWIL
jgi:hypothetical protein